MFQAHNPAQHTFDWYCNLIGVNQNNFARAARRLQGIVKQTREDYQSPFGKNFAYGQTSFQHGYLLAYFPYYIEPLYHTLKTANLPQYFFTKERLHVSFFGGGPCPEALGLAAYLREHAPNLSTVDISIFDREENWNTIQKGLLPQMLPYYSPEKTGYSIQNHDCNVITCGTGQCSNGSRVTGSDLVIAQNFLSEVQRDSDRTVDTFEKIVRRSNCRYLVFVENNYGKNKELLNMINQRLWSKKLSTGLANIGYQHTRPNFTLPRVLQENLFTGESGLMEKKNVKFYFMVIEIARA